jgi:hypothetical protein
MVSSRASDAHVDDVIQATSLSNTDEQTIIRCSINDLPMELLERYSPMSHRFPGSLIMNTY